MKVSNKYILLHEINCFDMLIVLFLFLQWFGFYKP